MRKSVSCFKLQSFDYFDVTSYLKPCSVCLSRVSKKHFAINFERNNLIVDNYAGYLGGGIHQFFYENDGNISELKIINNTIAYNTTSDYCYAGVGIFCKQGEYAVLRNNIIFGNRIAFS